MSVTKRLHSCGCLSASYMGGGREVGSVCNGMVVCGVCPIIIVSCVVV